MPYPESRSIPACTGEPGRQTEGRVKVEVYPRVYGGTVADGEAGGAGGGLSPRVRGNLLLSGQHYLCLRSIPACTGEPRVRAASTRQLSVYPRVYGGTVRFDYRRLYQDGLSPRVRGNPDRNQASKYNDGSIPACTGEPVRMTRADVAAWVYPRVYGGTEAGGRVVSAVDGLSPRVRGNPVSPSKSS